MFSVFLYFNASMLSAIVIYNNPNDVHYSDNLSHRDTTETRERPQLHQTEIHSDIYLPL